MFIKIQLQKEKSLCPYLIHFIPEIQTLVYHFLQKVIYLCQLTVPIRHLEISLDGFILPHKMSTDCLKKTNVYHVCIRNKVKTKAIMKRKLSSSSSSSLESSSSSSSLDSQESNQQQAEGNSTPVMKKIDKSRLKQILQKSQRKKPRIKKQKNMSQSEEEQEEPPKRKIKKITKSIQSSDDSQSSSLPILKTKKLPKIPSNTQVINPKKTVVKKIIKISSEESSLSDSELEKIEKKPQKGPTKKPLFVPSVVKSKQKVFKSFSENQEEKWLPITKEKLKKWEENNEEFIIFQNNKIRFKIMELDEEKFVPVTSGWITATVSEVDNSVGNHLIKMENVQQCKENSKPVWEKNYELPFLNMQQLQIHFDFLNEKQKMLMKDEGKEVQKQKVQQKQPQDLAHKDSIENFICGQTNYYFSDKSYNADLFTQMHANKDKDKFISIKLLLNFPKIKKVLRDEDKLWKYLTQDEKRQNRNYELDQERRMIRKRVQRMEAQQKEI